MIIPGESFGLCVVLHRLLRLLDTVLTAAQEDNLLVDLSVGPNQGAGVPAPYNDDGLLWELGFIQCERANWRIFPRRPSWLGFRCPGSDNYSASRQYHELNDGTAVHD